MTTLEVRAEAHVEARRSFGLRLVLAAFALVSTLGISIIAVRELTARGASTYLAVLAALAIGPLIGRLGLGTNAVRVLSADDRSTGGHQYLTRAQEGELASAHLWATLLMSVLTAPVVSWIATAGLAGDSRRPAVVAMTTVLIILEALRLTVSDLFAAVGLVRWSGLTTHHLRSGLSFIVIGAYAVVGDPTLLGMLLVMTVIAAFLLAPILRLNRRLPLSLRPVGLPALLTVIRAGLVLVTLDLFNFLVGRGDVWVASAFFSPLDSTRYSTASTLAGQVAILSALASAAIGPGIARLWRAGRIDELRTLLDAISTLGTLVTAAIAAATALVGSPIIGLAYGSHIRSAGLYLTLLACGSIATAALGLNTLLLCMTDHAREAAISGLLALGVIIPAGLAAGYWGGPLALAFTSASASAFIAVTQAYAAYRTMGFTTRPRLDVRGAVALFRSDNAAGRRLAAGEIVELNWPRTPAWLINRRRRDEPALRRPRRLWWIAPPGVVLLMVPATLLMAAGTTDSQFRTQFRSPKSVTGATLLLFGAGAAAFVAGCLIIMLRARRRERLSWPGWSDAELAKLRRAGSVLYWLTVFGYAALVVVAVGRGLRLSTLLHAFTSVSTDSDTLKTLFAPVTGITTLTQLGIAYVVIAVMAGRLRGDRRTQRRLGVILLLGVLRAYLLNERLAIVELLVPIMTALAARASASRSDRVRYAVWLAPLALIPGLVLGFSLFEYSRSYQALGQKTHQSFIAFGAQRLSGYYITAYNNGQLELNAEPTPRPLPYNTLEGLWTAPGVSQLKLYDKLTNFDEPAWFLDQLKQHGNPEFNSPSGLAIPFVELGTAGGLILFVCAGTIIGYAYCRFAEGGRMGLLLYPPLTTGLFELPRYLYWVEGRVMLPLVALAISGLWLGRRRVVAQRPVTTVTTATPELPAAVPA